ncbi:conserved hypothetical protein [Burkholderia pseudomallei 1655]|nr:conserved hypothetical protein [Burkholderia pseudomallei 1655]
MSVLAAMHGVSLSIATFSKNGGAVTVSGGAGDDGDIGMPSSDVAEERAPPNEVFGGMFGVEEMAIDACRLPEMKWRNVERIWMKPVPLRVRSMRDRSAVRLAGGVRCVS